MRLVLALIAAMLNTAGPWLCCCALAVGTAVPPRSADAHPVACPHCPPVESETPKPTKPASPCPCQPRLEATVPALPPETVTDPFDAAPDWTAWVEPLIVLVAIRAAPEAVSGLPFLTAETRLRVHHVLLC